MDIELRAPAPTIVVTNPDDLASLKVIGMRPPPDDERRYSVAGLSLTENGSHAYIAPVLIVAHVPDSTRTEQWRRGFDEMVAYAVSHGWSDDAGNLRAHTEWSGATAD